MTLGESMRRIEKDELTARDLFAIMRIMTQTHTVKFHLGVNKPDAEFQNVSPEKGNQIKQHSEL